MENWSVIAINYFRLTGQNFFLHCLSCLHSCPLKDKEKRGPRKTQSVTVLRNSEATVLWGRGAVMKPAELVRALREQTSAAKSPSDDGGVAEWSNAAVLKTVEAATSPGVRIPSPPPEKNEQGLCLSHFFPCTGF